MSIKLAEQQTLWAHHGQTTSKQRCSNVINVDINDVSTSFDHDVRAGYIPKYKPNKTWVSETLYF